MHAGGLAQTVGAHVVELAPTDAPLDSGRQPVVRLRVTPELTVVTLDAQFSTSVTVVTGARKSRHRVSHVLRQLLPQAPTVCPGSHW